MPLVPQMRVSPFPLVLAMAVALIAGPAGLGLARAETDADSSAEHTLRSPRTGLQFAIGSDLTLGAFQGTLISIRTRGPRGGGWRAGVDLRGTFWNTEDVSTTPDTTLRTEDDSRSAAVALAVQRLFEPAPHPGLSGYLGIGPRVQYSRDSDERPSLGSNSTTTWALGLSGAAGAEWLSVHGVSLHAEYGLTAAYTRSRGVNQSSQGFANVRHQRTFSVNGQSVRFGLTTWFR